MPTDPRALAVARGLLASPDGEDAAKAFAAAGARRRTLERRFAAETGMTLGAWRREARLLHALRLLAVGEPVTMFRRALGSTPGRY
jgi:AraC-like DNA-binding protein